MKIKRFLVVDFLRFWAMLLMFWDHSLKLFYNFNSQTGWENFFIRLATRSLEITSLSSALFLFLAGFSLVISFQKHTDQSRKTWIFKKWQKGIILIGLSYWLFFLEFGWEKTYLVLTSGILETIGLVLIFGSLLFLLNQKSRFVLAVMMNFLSLIADSVLRFKGIKIPLVNVYNFPLLPQISYSLTGIIIAEYFFSYPEKKRRQFLLKLFSVSLISFLILLITANFNPFILWQARFLIGGFWQPSGLLVIFNTAIIVLILTGLFLLGKKLQKLVFIRKISLLGQEALAIYFLHLLIGLSFAKYYLRGVKFGFWPSSLAVLVFLFLGFGWIKFRRIKENY